MSHKHHFHTLDDHDFNVTVEQVRHIEFTSDDHGENIIVLHRRDTGKEFVLDGEDAETTNEMNLLLREAHIY